MNRIIALTMFFMGACAASAQTTPCPSGATPLQSGGTCATTAAGALSNVAGNPAAGTYSILCTDSTHCATTPGGFTPGGDLGGSSTSQTVLGLTHVTNAAIPVAVSAPAIGNVQYFAAGLNGAVCNDSTDDTTAFASLLSSVGTAGGGTIEIIGKCLFNSATLNIPANVRLTGLSDSANGEWGSLPASPSVMDLQYNAGSTTAKITYLAVGKNEIDHLVLMDGGSDCATFILDINSTLHPHDVAFSGTASGASACNNAIVMGGTTTTTGNAVTDAFQGYGSTLENVFFDKIQNGVFGRVYSNAINMSNLTFSISDGGSCGTDIGAVVFDGSTGFSYASNLDNTLIEQSNYCHAIVLNSSQLSMKGVNEWDGTSSSLAGVYLANGTSWGTCFGCQLAGQTAPIVLALSPGFTATGTAVGGTPTQITLSSVTGTVTVGAYISGTGIVSNTMIYSQVSGTAGGAGVYQLSQSNTASAAAISSAGQSTTQFAWTTTQGIGYNSFQYNVIQGSALTIGQEPEISSSFPLFNIKHSSTYSPCTNTPIFLVYESGQAEIKNCNGDAQFAIAGSSSTISIDQNSIVQNTGNLDLYPGTSGSIRIQRGSFTFPNYATSSKPSISGAPGQSYYDTTLNELGLSNGSGYKYAGYTPGVQAWGTATLASGTVTVSNAAACSVGSTCLYTLQNCGVSGTAIGTNLVLGTITPGTSFVINSVLSSAPTSAVTTDNSTVCWRIN